jgi:hypothetical protein
MEAYLRWRRAQMAGEASGGNGAGGGPRRS